MATELQPDEDDAVALWAEIHRLRAAVQGPDGYATWQEAATAERVRRVQAEEALAKFDAQAATPSPAADAASGSPFEPGPARCAVRWLGRLPQASREYLSGEAFHKDCLDLAMMLEEWIAGHPAPPETPAAPVQPVGEKQG